MTEPRRGYRLEADLIARDLEPGLPATPAPPSQPASDPGSGRDAGSERTAHSADSGQQATLQPTPGFQQEIRFAVSIDGTRIGYAITGQGPTLLRAPHWMTHLDWDFRNAVLGARLRCLAREFRLVRYDTRGTGLSDRSTGPGGLDQWLQDMEAVVDAAMPPRFALVAFSGGGLVAIRYAAAHPERLTCLVLLGGMARGALHRGVPKAHVDAFAQLIRDGWAQDNPAFRQLMTTQLWPRAEAAQMRAFNEMQRVSSSAEHAAMLIRTIAGSTVESELPRVRVPTLVLHSANDARIPFSEAQLIASRIPDATLVPFDSPNHTPLDDEPAFAQVQGAINAFVHRHSQVAARPRLVAGGPLVGGWPEGAR